MGVSADSARLARLLGDGDLDWLVTRLRSRIEHGRPLNGTVSLVDPTPAQRAAVERLLGRRPRAAGSLTVPLAQVEKVLTESGIWSDGLAAAIAELSGPVTPRADARQRLEAAWRDAFAPLAAAVDGRPELHDWFVRLDATGLVRRLTGTPDVAAPVVADLARVVTQLPASGEPLGRFAARVLGDAHALDDGRPLTTLALGAARALAGLDSEVRDAAGRREAWAGVGLLRDDVSSTVLTLGLPGDSRSATGRALAALREAGEPSVLTLRQLVRGEPVFALAGRSVFVCENPVVVTSAADALGSSCAPLVCVAGQPGAAALHLLRLLARGGATLRYHGDFDWGGITIANLLVERIGVLPWRFGVGDYRRAVDAGLGGPLPERRVEARWDAELAAAMAGAGRKVEEELVLDSLLGDLTVGRPS